MSEERKKVELSDDEVVQVSGGQSFEESDIVETKLYCDYCHQACYESGYLSPDTVIVCPHCGRGKAHVARWSDEQDNRFFPKN